MSGKFQEAFDALATSLWGKISKREKPASRFALCIPYSMFKDRRLSQINDWITKNIVGARVIDSCDTTFSDLLEATSKEAVATRLYLIIREATRTGSTYKLPCPTGTFTSTDIAAKLLESLNKKATPAAAFASAAGGTGDNPYAMLTIEWC